MDITKEASTIIKAREAHAVAFSQLKDNYDTLEIEYEKLKGSMLDLEMQKDMTYGELEEEVRLRPKTLNMINYTRSLCDNLPLRCSRLSQALNRCRNNQIRLYNEIFNASSVELDKIKKIEKIKAKENKIKIAAGLNNKLKLVKKLNNIKKERVQQKEQQRRGSLAHDNTKADQRQQPSCSNMGMSEKEDSKTCTRDHINKRRRLTVQEKVTQSLTPKMMCFYYQSSTRLFRNRVFNIDTEESPSESE